MEPTQILEAMKAFKSVYELLKDIKKIFDKSKKRGWKLFSSKKKETIEGKFKEALVGSKNAIESSIWWGKGFAIGAECGINVDEEFHHLMGLLVSIFNDTSLKVDPEKLDEKLVEHLVRQFKILEDYAGRFWNIQGMHDHPEKEKNAIEIIKNFKSRLWDFQKSMEPYMRKAEEDSDRPRD